MQDTSIKQVTENMDGVPGLILVLSGIRGNSPAGGRKGLAECVF